MKHITFILLLSVLLLNSCTRDDYFNDNSNYTSYHRNNGNDTVPVIDSLAFTPTEKDTILAADTNITMRILTIPNYEDSLFLRQQTSLIRPDSTDSVLHRLIRRMYYTVTDPVQGGVGLAAPQVGIGRRLIWVKRMDKTGQPFEYYINPFIIETTSSVVGGTEGCLSIPNQSAFLYRYKAIHIEYDQMDGTHKSEIIEGYTARIFQHEIDHLEGVLYIDYLTKKTIINAAAGICESM